MNPKLQQNNAAHEQIEVIPQSIEVHPSVSPLAAKLLEGVIEILMREPELYKQNTCGTLCGGAQCILGHMGALNRSQFSASDFHRAARRNLCEQIGLSLDQGLALYEAKRWPTSPSSILHPTPQDGIARIEHFLTTGE